MAGSFTTNPYCTLADVKTMLSLPTSDTAKDAQLTGLIPVAQELIDDWVGRKFQTYTGQLNFDGYGQDKLLVGDFQSITQVLEVSYANWVGSTGNEMVVSATLDITNDIIPGPYDRQIRGLPYIWIKRKSGLEFMPAQQNYQITGTFGNPNIPAWANRVCARICAHWYEMSRTQYADSTSTKDGVHQKYTKNLPADVVELLNYHRRHYFGARF